MKGTSSRSAVRVLFAGLGVVAVIAAFLRGNYLFGIVCGIVYAAVALALLWLLVRSQTPVGRVSVSRVVLVVLFALPVGYAMAFPASINADVQVAIDQHATDREARAELAAVFGSDPKFRDLSVSSVHTKMVNLTVRGSLSTRPDLDRLRARIAAECPALRECLLHWDVDFRDTGQRVDGLDQDLFPEAEPSATAAPGPQYNSRRRLAEQDAAPGRNGE